MSQCFLVIRRAASFKEERLEIHIAGSLFEGSLKTTVKTPEDKVQQTVEN